MSQSALRSCFARVIFALAATTSVGCSHDLSFLDPRDASSDVQQPVDALVCSSPADMQPCDPVRNCNCSSGQTCAAPDLDQRRIRCVRIGQATEGTSCLGPGECAAGLSCVRFTCRRACRSRGDCQANEQCVTDDPRGSVGVCARSNECMIEPSTGCSGGVHCRPELLTLLGESGVAGVAWCEELDGTAGEGADCESAGCQRGMYCESAGAGFACVRPCTQGSQCTTAGRARCDLTSSPVLIGATVWGQCAP